MSTPVWEWTRGEGMPPCPTCGARVTKACLKCGNPRYLEPCGHPVIAKIIPKPS